MPKLKFTAAAVARLSTPETGRIDYFDAALPAFGLRVSKTGARKYFLMTRIDGKQVRLTLGVAKVKDDAPGLTLKEAREKAAEFGDLIERGIDPRQLKAVEKQLNQELSQNTFKAVGERFMRQHVDAQLTKSTAREYRRVLTGPDTADWQNKLISSISKADVLTVLDNMVERGSAGAANNTLAYLRKFFNWCTDKDLIEIPPTDRIKKPGPTNVGHRVLTLEECADVWRAFDAEGGAFGDLFKLLLLTGQRRSEVGGMRREELADLDGKSPTWNISAIRTKNARPHIVPLSKPAVEIIQSRPEIGDKGLFFTNTGKAPVSGYGRAKQRIDAWIAKDRENQERPTIPPWTLHDLRRTMVTIMNENLGVAPHVVEACVNHISGGAKAGVAGVYNKALYLDDRRKALVAWAELVRLI
jgi:integrase